MGHGRLGEAAEMRSAAGQCVSTMRLPGAASRAPAVVFCVVVTHAAWRTCALRAQDGLANRPPARHTTPLTHIPHITLAGRPCRRGTPLTVLYPAGHNVVIFNTEQKTQRFISGTEKTEGITAIAVSPNKKYVAVAERAAEGEKALVTVFDLHTLKRRKVLQAVASDVMSREFVCLAFSPDSKGLLTHGGAPDWTLVYWLWEKAKVGAVSKSSNAQNAVYQVSFNPVDNMVVCVTGDGICRFLRITDQTLKPLPGAMGKREPQAYLCHAW
eukprot:scaffold104937_cov75-Phaeocystis_antarctica.AAC.10